MPVHECVRAYVCSMYLAVKKPQKIKKLLVSFMKDEVRQSCSMAQLIEKKVLYQSFSTMQLRPKT